MIRMGYSLPRPAGLDVVSRHRKRSVGEARAEAHCWLLPSTMGVSEIAHTL